MNRPRSIIRPKPFGSSRRIPRTRPEAAAELVRVEYERERLLREMMQLGARRAAASSTLRRLDQRAKVLHAQLDSAQVATKPSDPPAGPASGFLRRRRP